MLVPAIQFSLSQITPLSLITGVYERAGSHGVPNPHFQTSSRALGPHPLRVAPLSWTTQKHGRALPNSAASPRRYHLLGSDTAFSVIGVGGVTTSHRQERESEGVPNWLTGSLLLHGEAGGQHRSTAHHTGRRLLRGRRVWTRGPGSGNFLQC